MDQLSLAQPTGNVPVASAALLNLAGCAPGPVSGPGSGPDLATTKRRVEQPSNYPLTQHAALALSKLFICLRGPGPLALALWPWPQLALAL